MVPSASIDRLRHIARSLWKSGKRSFALGIEVDDLVHVGWLAYLHAAPVARTPTYAYARARYAMLDEIRSVYGMKGKYRRHVFERFYLYRHDREAARGMTAAEYEESYAVATAMLARTFRPSIAETMRMLILDEMPPELVAAAQGRSPDNVRVTRWYGLKRLRAKMAA